MATVIIENATLRKFSIVERGASFIRIKPVVPSRQGHEDDTYWFTRREFVTYFSMLVQPDAEPSQRRMPRSKQFGARKAVH
jgi:hypothetical protein